MQVARGLSRGTFELKLLTEDKSQHDGAAISVLLQPKEVAAYSPNRKVTLFPINKWEMTAIHREICGLNVKCGYGKSSVFGQLPSTLKKEI